MDAIWRPTAEVVERANVMRLMRRHGLARFRDLLRLSIEDPDAFWRSVVEDLGIEFTQPFERVRDDSRGLPWTTWFVGGRLNIAWNCVHRWAQGPRADEPAVVFDAEDGGRAALTFGELSREVTRLAEGLARLGVGEGDRVATFLPMSPQAVVASHAVAHLGAVQVPVFSGFAAPSVAQRLQDAGATVAITADASLRRGREIPMKQTLDEAAREAPALEHVVVWRRHGHDVVMHPGRDVWWEELVAGCPGTLEPRPVDAEAPYLLVYTSGTTGKPKGVVHVQGGLLASVAREAAYQADLRAGDVLHFATDMGWIMGPWTVLGGGVTGATLVLAEGAPDWPADRLWRLVERERVTVLGVSPTLVRALVQHGDPQDDLSSLRLIVTTGEPWNPEPYRWLFHAVGGGRAPIMNITGGTEVGACFLSPTIVEPVKEVSVGFPTLGMDVDVVDAEGTSVVGTGQVGELICRNTGPGMTRGFHGDPERYLDTYWRRFPGVWTHGDWASVDADGYWYLHGRSDDTLNIAGKRIGPAEIESAVVGHPAVTEAAAVGVPHEMKGEVVWVFCALATGRDGDDGLAEELRGRVADAIGKAFRPERVVFVSALPKTRSAKIVRRAVRAAALGRDPGDLSSVENPDALEDIERALRMPAGS
jgi:acetyl-CoA synthetase